LRPMLYRQGVGCAGTVHSEPSTALGVNHKTAHLMGGQSNGIDPNAQKSWVLLHSPPPVGWRWGRALCRWEVSHRPCYRASIRRIECAQHGTADYGGAVAAAEFARLEAFGEGAVHGALDGASGLGRPRMSMTVAEPVEHQRGGKNHGGRIGEPLAHDVGRGAVAGLEHRMRVSDVRRGSIPLAAE